ncbi:adenylyl-sulfate kinase [Helicobacter monodelphidis]|uniref:adenylyl-sulfate kinase n=1 Tax=Helicobacter sp. 15-1451 TaxID=2004995 RepID=UPI000DCDD3DD|nr:adenylyl-sulfate kinase [Helicobacter sp. 15-1451]RAX58364.1 adenylyl-sulfate kinase [Helicobacter sp. 15-1451]
MKQEYGLVVWLTGLAGSGKSTIGRALYQHLRQRIKHIVYLDGDEFRELFESFGYDRSARVEVSRKRSKLCSFLSSQGIIVIASTVSLYQEIYKLNRANMPNYLEIYVQCDLQELIQRDQKGLYTQALNGETSNVVGVDIPFDEPQADLIIQNHTKEQLESNIQRILEQIKEKIQ